MIGEIGGTAEEERRRVDQAEAKKLQDQPVAGFIAGPAPPGRRMGHAGAIVRRQRHGRRQDRRLLAAGIAVADTPASLGTTLAKVLSEGGGKGWFSRYAPRPTILGQL